MLHISLEKPQGQQGCMQVGVPDILAPLLLYYYIITRADAHPGCQRNNLIGGYRINACGVVWYCRLICRRYLVHLMQTASGNITLKSLTSRRSQNGQAT